MMEPAKVETQPKDTHSVLAPRPYPWLLITDMKHKERQTLLNVSENRYYTERIPEMSHKKIYPCSHGWMALVGGNGDSYLWNPISLEKVQLPHLEPFDYESCLLSSPPRDATCHILFFNFFDNFFLVCKPGDLEFTKHEFERGDESTLLATAVVGKTIYCLTFPNHTLFTLEFLGAKVQYRQQITVELPWPKPAPPEIVLCRDFLVESGSELFFVQQMLFGLFAKDVYGFIVMRMDSSERRWIRVKSIGERTMFLCHHRGMSCVATGSGIKPNSIYFTEPESRFLYVYDLEYLSISKSLPCPTVRRDSELQWTMV